jgi:antitoxin (DNA-binding transcriptional repressor) of toxin-antitoxin stability system
VDYIPQHGNHPGCSEFDITPQTFDERAKMCKSDFMRIRINATQTARQFSELMNRVRYRGESFIVERGGQPICEILPAQPARFRGDELAELLESLPTPDEGYLNLIEKLAAKQPKVAASKWPR